MKLVILAAMVALAICDPQPVVGGKFVSHTPCDTAERADLDMNCMIDFEFTINAQFTNHDGLDAAQDDVIWGFVFSDERNAFFPTFTGTNC